MRTPPYAVQRLVDRGMNTLIVIVPTALDAVDHVMLVRVGSAALTNRI